MKEKSEGLTLLSYLFSQAHRGAGTSRKVPVPACQWWYCAKPPQQPSPPPLRHAAVPVPSSPLSHHILQLAAGACTGSHEEEGGHRRGAGAASSPGACPVLLAGHAASAALPSAMCEGAGGACCTLSALLSRPTGQRRRVCMESDTLPPITTCSSRLNPTSKSKNITDQASCLCKGYLD